MNRNLLFAFLVFSTALVAACATTYPRQTSVDAMEDITETIANAPTYGQYKAAVIESSAGLIEIASNSIEDGQLASDDAQIMRSAVLTARATTILAMAQEAEEIEGLNSWLSSLDREAEPSAYTVVAKFASTAAAVCKDRKEVRTKHIRECAEARLYRDAAHLNLLFQRFANAAHGTSEGSEVERFCSDASESEPQIAAQYRCASATADELRGQFDTVWVTLASSSNESEFRAAYLRPMLCNFEASMTSIMQNIRPQPADLSRHQQFMKKAKAATAAGGQAAKMLDAAATNASEADRYEMVRSKCQSWRGLN